MRWGIIAALVLGCGVACGEPQSHVFELPFSEKPPRAVQKIMDDAQKSLRTESKKVLEATEKQLKETLRDFLVNEKQAEANFTKATLDVYRTWLLRQEFYNQTPSPVGKWQLGNGWTLTLYADHTGETNYADHDVLWAEDGLGIIRVISAKSHRNIYEREFAKKEGDHGALNSDILQGRGDPSHMWTRIKN